MRPGLLTDLYEVTMALSYVRERMVAPATFSLFARKLPAQRGFLVAAGLERALDLLLALEVGDEELAAYAAALEVPAAAVEGLRGLRFTGDVRAVPEGRVVLAGEPLLEVTAPLPQAQLAETLLLNQLTFATAQASKAARCVLAAGGVPVVDFALRRTHGAEAGGQAARAAAIVGFAGTSHVGAADRYGLAAVGTMAHSYVEAFASEEAAFRAFAASRPGVPVTLLVDTYDVDEGVRTAARVITDLGLPATSGIRLDSGDLGALAYRARTLLDAAGLPRPRIIVSGGLDEYGIAALVADRAPVDVFAVGTKVGTSADAPYLDTAYKLVAYDGRAMMKLSTGKVTLPGAKQVFRRAGTRDEIGLADEAGPEAAQPLLVPHVTGGRRTGPALDERARVAAARAWCAADLAQLPEPARRIVDPQAPRPTTSAALAALTERTAAALAAQHPR